jgi:hypothetical protein
MSDMSGEFLESVRAEQASEPEPKTNSEQLAEIEGQATDYTPPDGWRLLEVGETITLGDEYVESDYRRRYPTKRVGSTVGATELYIRRIDRPEPIQVCEGRWRTRHGDIRNIIPTPGNFERAGRYTWYDAQYDQTWLPSGHYHINGESPLDLREYLGKSEPEPEQTITPDDVAAEALAGVNEWPSVKILRRQLETTKAALLEQQQRNEELVTQGSQQRMENAELQRELAESQRRVLSQRIRIQDLLTMNEATEPQPEASPVLQQVMIEAQAETIARLNSEIHTLNTENVELQIQVESLNGRLQEQTAKSAKRLEYVKEMRSEVSYVQGLLNESRQRVTELEELVGSLRTINDAQEKAFDAAGKENTALRLQLAAVKEELTTAAADRQRLQIELDAAQQVPADSPELRRVVELETLVEKHVDTIGRMQQEIQQQQRELQKRALRIFDLDTISTAQEKAVVDAGKQNDELRAAIDAADKQLDQKDAQIRDLRIELDAAQQVPQANDKLAQLEALQPMAAACSTVQTMVRDMLGHMRCLVSLNSTTDRSNFCTLLESILEVFDDVECDDDETSEAEQG